MMSYTGGGCVTGHGMNRPARDLEERHELTSVLLYIPFHLVNGEPRRARAHVVF